MEAVPHQSRELNTTPSLGGAPAGSAAGPANLLVCPECGMAYDTEFAPSYHRETSHGPAPLAGSPPDYRDALSKVRNAVIAGFISAAVTVIFAVTGFMGNDARSIIDAALIMGLAIGVWNRSRWCAIALFVVWIIEKVVQLVSEPGTWPGLPIGVAFAVFFYQGISGTFAYHRLRGVRHEAEKM